MLHAHRIAARLHEASAPGRGHVHSGWKGRILVGCTTTLALTTLTADTKLTETNAERRVLHAQASEIESWDGTRVAYTRLALPSHTRGEIDLLQQRQAAHKLLGFFIRILPTVSAAHPGRRVGRWRRRLRTGRRSQGRDGCYGEPHVSTRYRIEVLNC